MGAKVKIRVTPEGQRLQRILKELKELEVRVGFQHGKTVEPDGTDICDIAAWNELGTEHTPARPFLRKSVDDNKNRIKAFLEYQMQQMIHGVSAEQALKEIGIFQKDLIQEKITEGSFIPNAVSTIIQKGSSKPLVDTGRMRQSVNYVVKKKESGDG